MRNASPVLVCAVLTASTAIAASPPAPHLVSPGNEGQEGRVSSECPTFSWAPAQGSTGYLLVAYGLSEAGRDNPSQPLLQVDLPEGATSWTPSLGACLPGAGHYSWAVGARGENGEIQWSTPGVFRVVAPETPREREPRRPAAITRLDGVSAPAVRASAPLSVAASRSASAPPRSFGAEAFSPPACDGGMFSDVGINHPLCAWIEKSAADQILTQCAPGAPGRFCPDNPVTRSQLALFGERIMRGTDTWRPELGDGATPNLPPGAPTLTPLDATGDPGWWSSITIGVDGLGLISYFDGLPPPIIPPPPGLTEADPPPPNHDLKVAHCSNVDCTAATITPLDTAGIVGEYTSITIGQDGRGLISYFDRDNLDLKVAHCSDVNCTAATITSLDTADVGQWTSITIGADGFGLISYYDLGNSDLKVAHCSNVNCTAATITSLDTADDVGRYTSIAIGADGLGLISYYHASNADLMVAHCSNVNCTSATITPLDTTDVVGQWTSVAIGADGLGLISYARGHSLDQDLVVAHCSNVNCAGTTDTPTPLDTAGNVGSYTSVTIGADGLGLISYTDIDNADLKVAHCSNVNCTAATITSLDTEDLVGAFTAVTIGTDGLGLISYLDVTNDSLNVAHCPNVLCAPYFRRR